MRPRLPAKDAASKRALLVFALVVAVVVTGCSRPPETSSAEDGGPEKGLSDQPARFSNEGAAETPTEKTVLYAGSESCRECHSAEYVEWSASNHALAERMIDPDKDGSAFTASSPIHHGSVTSRVRKRDGRFEIVTQGPDGKTHAYAVERVIGNTPLRQFLIPFDRGRYQVTELAYDLLRGEWFDVFGQEDRRPSDWGHWTGRGMTWNSMCADCHNTNLRKNYDAPGDRYETTYSEIGVGCEACHGPAAEHVAWQEAHAGESGASSSRDPTLETLLSAYASDRMLDACAACHSRRAELRETFRAGDPHLDAFLPALPGETQTWYADGQVHEEDYVYASFLMSRMYAEGVRCKDCHQPHALWVRFEGNAMCLRCHEDKIDPAGHSFHDVSQPGGQCVNCHMPQTTYMERHPRRDHGFTIPDPLLTRQYGIPNACNRCHDDQSVDWALEAVERWYGDRMERDTRRRAQLIARARRREPGIEAELIEAIHSETKPAWRAVLAGLLEAWGDESGVRGELIRLLRDESPLVRVRAAQTLYPLDAAADRALRQALRDPRRAVRIAAAWSLGPALSADAPAARELREDLEHNADQPAGALALAQFLRDHGQPRTALERLRRAIEWEPGLDALHHALGVTLSMLGRSREAVEAIERACELSPDEPQWWSALGLARAEVRDFSGAIEALRRAVRLEPQFTRAWYNLALAHNAMQQHEQAIDAMRRTVQLEPNNADYWFALATVLRDAGRIAEAREAADECLRRDESHRQARALLRVLDSP